MKQKPKHRLQFESEVQVIKKDSPVEQVLEAVVSRCSSNSVFLKTLRIPQKSTCVGVFLRKLQAFWFNPCFQRGPEQKPV